MEEQILNQKPSKKLFYTGIALSVLGIGTLVACVLYFKVGNKVEQNFNYTKTPPILPPRVYTENQPLPQQARVPAIESNGKSDLSVLFYAKNSLKAWQNGQLKTLVDYSKTQDSVANVVVSPNGNLVVFGHFNYDKDGGASGLFSSGINSIALVSLQDNSLKDIGQSGKTAKWHFNWSPDSKYFSYIVNDGKGVEILDVNDNKVVFSSNGEESSPLVWLDTDHFSFVQDHKLYLGTLQNPKEKVVAQNVYNSLPSFEDPPNLIAPLWSKDGKFVSYYTKNGYNITDVENNRIFSVKPGQTLRNDAGGADFINLDPIGWDLGNNFYFATHSQDWSQTSTQRFVTANGTQGKFENLYAGPGRNVSQISPNKNFFVFDKISNTNNPRNGYSINQAGDNGAIACNNSLGFSEGPILSAKNSWSKKFNIIVAVKSYLPQGYVVSLMDLSSCKVLDNITVSDQYGDTGLDFAEIQ